MRVLGIDPGSLTTGWGLLAGTSARPRMLACGTIRLGSKRPMADRLACLQRELGEVVSGLQPTAAAVETPFHGASARSALQLAQARGVVLAVLGRAGVPVAEYAPAAVKKSLTGDGRADKARVGAMVVHLLGAETQGRRHDVHDALAIALCHLGAATLARAVERARTGPGTGA